MAVQQAGTEPTASALDATQLATWLLLAVLVTIPLHIGEILWASSGGAGDSNRRVAVYLYDLPLFLLVVVAAADGVERVRAGHRMRWSVPGYLAAGAGAWYVMATLVQPSWRAVDLLFHVAGAWAVGRTVVHAAAPGRRVILHALVAFGTVQAVLGVVQSRLGETLGIPYLEWNARLIEFGGVAAGRGSLTHPYHLATVLLVCIGATLLLLSCERPRVHVLPLCAALSLLSLAVTLTFSRAAAISMALMLALIVPIRHLRSRAIPAIGLGLLIGLVLAAEGVSAKVEMSTSARFDSGRRELIRESVDSAADSWVFGVGPGQIAVELAEATPGSTPVLPHNLFAHAAAEAGLMPAMLLAASGATGAAAVIRRGALPTLIAVGPVPFLLLDAFPYAFPVGLVFSGVWIGLMVAVARVDPSFGSDADAGTQRTSTSSDD